MVDIVIDLCPQSSLVLRFVNNDFQENKEPTIGGKPTRPGAPASPSPPSHLLRRTVGLSVGWMNDSGVSDAKMQSPHPDYQV